MLAPRLRQILSAFGSSGRVVQLPASSAGTASVGPVVVVTSVVVVVDSTIVDDGAGVDSTLGGLVTESTALGPAHAAKTTPIRPTREVRTSTFFMGSISFYVQMLPTHDMCFRPR